MNTQLDYLIKLTYDRTYKGYVADVVNLYGCMSQGKTKQEARANARKAISAYMKVFANQTKPSEIAVERFNVPISFAVA